MAFAAVHQSEFCRALMGKTPIFNFDSILWLNRSSDKNSFSFAKICEQFWTFSAFICAYKMFGRPCFTPNCRAGLNVPLKRMGCIDLFWFLADPTSQTRFLFDKFDKKDYYFCDFFNCSDSFALVSSGVPIFCIDIPPLFLVDFYYILGKKNSLNIWNLKRMQPFFL